MKVAVIGSRDYQNVRKIKDTLYQLKQKFDNPLDLFNELYTNKNYTAENLKGSQQLAVRARAQFIFGKYLGGSMINIFEGDKKKADEMVTNMILYAGSRAKSSSPHFKASDISSF